MNRVESEASGSAAHVGRAALWRGEIDNCCYQNTVIRFRPHLTLPEYALPKRRRQILDDETDAHRSNASEHESTSVHEDIWVGSFMARLAGLIRNLHRKK